MSETVKGTIQIKYGDDKFWGETHAEKLLAPGQMGLNTTTGEVRVGTGTNGSTWANSQSISYCTAGRNPNNTLGTNATAEGTYTTASGAASHAEGQGTIASGLASHAGGYYTITKGAYQTAIGKYNKADETTENTSSDKAFIIGNGESDTERSNALSVDWDGNLEIAGSITSNKKSFLDLTYPVGSIYMSMSSTSPASLFGGTWTQTSSGRVLVGQYSADVDFDTSGKFGGSKTHTLTAAQSGTQSHNHGSAGGPGSIMIHGAGSGGTPVQSVDGIFGAGITCTGYVAGTKYTSPGSVGRIDLNTTHTHADYSSNATQAHNNMQPYLVCYIWKRVS